MTPEQKVQLRGMATDLAIRANTPLEDLVAKSTEIFNFLMADIVAEQERQQAAVAAKQSIKLV